MSPDGETAQERASNSLGTMSYDKLSRKTGMPNVWSKCLMLVQIHGAYTCLTFIQIDTQEIMFF